MCKIKINHKEKALVNCKTAEIIRPTCFDSLAALHSYLCGLKREDEADEILKKVFRGEKVISDMIEKAQEEASIPIKTYL
jgi:hypothetical protein